MVSNSIFLDLPLTLQALFLKLLLVCTSVPLYTTPRQVQEPATHFQPNPQISKHPRQGTCQRMHSSSHIKKLVIWNHYLAELGFKSFPFPQTRFCQASRISESSAGTLVTSKATGDTPYRGCRSKLCVAAVWAATTRHVMTRGLGFGCTRRWNGVAQEFPFIKSASFTTLRLISNTRVFHILPAEVRGSPNFRWVLIS